MFRNHETKTLPYYVLGVVGLLAIFGTPYDAESLIPFINGGPYAFVFFQVILALGSYNLSQMFVPGGRGLREAMLANPIPPSMNRILAQAAILVCILWGIIVVFCSGMIWYNNSFSAMLSLWEIWPHLLYTFATTFAALILIASGGLFRSFMGAYFGFQILFFLGTFEVTFKELKFLVFINEFSPHPFPLFNLSLNGAQNWPIFNLIYLMATPALFAYAYKVWRERQWYLRRA